MLPGQKGLQIPLLGWAASMDAAKTDPATGRQRGMAERALGAGGGLATGIATSRAGLIPAIALGVGGALGGAAIGRQVDKRLLGHRPGPPARQEG